jgi:hypothetical protein
MAPFAAPAAEERALPRTPVPEEPMGAPAAMMAAERSPSDEDMGFAPASGPEQGKLRSWVPRLVRRATYAHAAAAAEVAAPMEDDARPRTPPPPAAAAPADIDMAEEAGRMELQSAVRCWRCVIALNPHLAAARESRAERC